MTVNRIDCTKINMLRFVSHVFVKITFCHFFVANKTDFVLTKLFMSICKDALPKKTCNIHNTLALTAMNVFNTLLNIHFF